MLTKCIIIYAIIASRNIARLHEIIGFDCNEKKDIQMLTLSNWQDCKKGANIKMEKVYIQLIQRKEFEDIPYYTCTLEVTERIIKSKLAQIFTFELDNNPYTLLTKEQISQQDCKRAHLTRRFIDPLDRSIKFDLKQNKASATKVDSFAFSSHYYDRSGRVHTNVELKLEATFEIARGTARNIIETNTIIFPNSGKCNYLSTKCQIKDINYFWEPLNRTSCFEYFVIYEGDCMVETNTDNSSDVSYQAISSEQKQQFITFQKAQTEACGKKLFKTENDKIFIANRMENFIERDTEFSTSNVDLSILFNMKISTVLTHISKQTNNLYEEIIYQKCIEDSKSMLNLLTQIGYQGFIPIDRDGNYLTTAGEGIKMIKCQIHNLTLYETKNCYDAFPVYYNHEKAFVVPYTRIITNESKIIDCSKHPTLLYNKNGTLLSISNGKMSLINVQYEKFKPNSIKWEFAKLEAVSSKGIYDATLLEKKKKDEILFNIEEGNEMKESFEERKFNEYEHMIKMIIDRILQLTFTFGTYSASFIGLAVIIQILRKISRSIFKKK